MSVCEEALNNAIPYPAVEVGYPSTNLPICRLLEYTPSSLKIEAQLGNPTTSLLRVHSLYRNTPTQNFLSPTSLAQSSTTHMGTLFAPPPGRSGNALLVVDFASGLRFW
jgi:hypothetical protein